jgi:hypothetical protein
MAVSKKTKIQCIIKLGFNVYIHFNRFMFCACGINYHWYNFLYHREDCNKDLYIHACSYDPETNKTSLRFIIFFDDTTDAEDAARSASKTYDIVGSVLPILIDNQPVTFGENDSFLIRPTIDSQVETSTYLYVFLLSCPLSILQYYFWLKQYVLVHVSMSGFLVNIDQLLMKLNIEALFLSPYQISRLG